MNSNSHISVLPDDCLMEIFENLNFKEKFGVQRVCKRFCDVTADMFGSLDHLTLYYLQNSSITSETSKGRELVENETVYFNETSFSNSWFRSFLTNFRILKRLVVESYRCPLKCEFLVKLLQFFPNLTSLTISDTTLEPDKKGSWNRFRKLTSGLESIGFHGHQQVQYWPGVKNLLEEKNWKEVSIQFQLNVQTLNALRSLDQLTKLEVQIKTLSQFKSVLKNKSKLKELSVLFNLEFVKFFDILGCLGSCANLRVLRLESLKMAESPKDVHIYKYCQQLINIRQLEISNLTIDSKTIKKIVQKAPNVSSLKLNSFHLKNLFLEARDFFEAISGFLLLRKLSLQHGKSYLTFPCEFLEFLDFQKLPKLRFLEFNCFEKKACLNAFTMFAKNATKEYFCFKTDISCQDKVYKDFLRDNEKNRSNVYLFYECVCGEAIYHSSD